MIWKIKCNAYKMGFDNGLSLGFDFGWSILKELVFEACMIWDSALYVGPWWLYFYDYSYLEYVTGRGERPVVFVLDLDYIFELFLSLESLYYLNHEFNGLLYISGSLMVFVGYYI